jgi:hypothetical protein
MSIKGLSSNAGITKTTGRPKMASIGYGRGVYIINYNRNSVNIHKGQSVLRKLFGR